MSDTDSRIDLDICARWRNGSKLRPRTLGVAVIAFAASMTLGSDPGWTYIFYRSAPDASVIPRSDAAAHWNRRVWGPGDILTFYVADDPDWSPHFRDATEALPQITAALDAWGDIPTADIRLRVGGVVEGATIGRDNRNVISVERGENLPNFARVWTSTIGGEVKGEECDVLLRPATVAHMADEEHPIGLTRLIHEVGHCLGLGHAVATPTRRWSEYQDVPWLISSVWQQDPVMSYGESVNNLLTEDDVVGASLLRPARGWLRDDRECLRQAHA